MNTYSLLLVMLSALISATAVFCTLDICARRTSYPGAGKWRKALGAMTLGLGIWGMHQILLAAYPPLEANLASLFYYWGGTWAWVLAVIWLSFFFLSRVGRPILSGLLLSVGIGAMPLVAKWLFQPRTLSVEGMVGVGAGFVITFFAVSLIIRWMHDDSRKESHSAVPRLRSGLAMGFLLTGAHWLAIALPTSSMPFSPDHHALAGQSPGWALLAGAGCLLLVLLLWLYRHRLHERYLQSLYHYHPDLVLFLDLEGKVHSASHMIRRYGYDREQLAQQHLEQWVLPELREQFRQQWLLALERGPVHQQTVLLTGAGRHMEADVFLIPAMEGQRARGMFAIIRDHAEDKQAQDTLAEAEAKYRVLVENSMLGIFVYQEGALVYANQHLSKMLDMPLEELLHRDYLDFIHPADRELVRERMRFSQGADPSASPYRYRVMLRGDRVRTFEARDSHIYHRGKPAVCGMVMDITDRVEAEEKIAYMAYYDEWTGLPNRHALGQRLDFLLADSKMKALSLLYLEVDQYNLIEEAMGQELGRSLEREVARRIRDNVGTTGEVAKAGPNQFLVLLPQFNKSLTWVLAEHLLEELARPYQLEGYELYITASIGVSLYPHDGSETEVLVQKAYSALRHARRSGKNTVQFYSSSLSDSVHQDLELEMALRKAVSQGEFWLEYQPAFDLHTGRITGVEALIRWDHPDHQGLSPEKLIRIAEETGLIVPIGEWALETACRQLGQWQKAGLPTFHISVNLSIRQLFHPGFVDKVSAILEETGIQPESLELEITESKVIDMAQALDVLKRLKELGIKISLDDFGTGLSSMRLLMEAPFHKIKIHHSFIHPCHVDADHEALVKTIISMARQMGLEVIAEGVETREQLIFLQQHMCHEAQGFLLCPPLPPERLSEQFDELEQVVGRLGIPREVQHEQWIRQEMELSRQDLLNIVRLHNGFIFKVVREGEQFIPTFCEGKLLYRLGLTPELVVGRRLPEILHPECIQMWRSYLRRAWEGESVLSFEGRQNQIDFLVTLQPVFRSGQVVEIIGSVVEITERKKVEEALRLSEQKTRLIAENMSDMMMILSTEGVVKYISESHEAVLGVSLNFLEGRSIFELVDPDYVSMLKQKMEHLLENKTSFQIEFPALNRRGQRIILESKWIPILDQNEEIEHVVVATRDITEQKQTEEYIRQSEKLSLAGQLAAGVAHEIRNPLTTVKGFLQLMQTGISKPGYIELMLREIEHIEGIINEFLTLAKPQVTKMAPTDMGQLLEQMLTLYESQALLNNVQIVRDLDPDLPLVCCDEKQIKQVFINILQNAVEAMPDGGTIRIEARLWDREHIAVRIHDQGGGIPKERLKKIGEPFYSTKEKGTGLGMMISQKIVQEHGGRMNIDSTLHRGTTVEVILPLKQCPQAP